jgi:hypothetical protein
MKRLVAVSVILILLIPLAASVGFPRHVDLATASDEIPYGPDFLLFYGLIFGAFSSQNYSGVSSLLKQTGLMHLPPSVSFVINKFNSLINSTKELLQSAQFDIKNATFFVGLGRVNDARIYLSNAQGKLDQANSTVDELEKAANEVVAVTGISQNEFIPKVHALRTLLNQYWAEIPPLRQRILGSLKLAPTALSLTVTPSSIKPGSKVAVTGALRIKSGLPLNSRHVTLFFQNSNISSATTSADGSFSASLTTPVVYIRNVSVFASYVPTGNDTLYYIASSSPSVSIQVLFDSPILRASIQKTGYPGLPIFLNGNFSNGGKPLSGFIVGITAFGSTTHVRTDKVGVFSESLVVPSGYSSGASTVSMKTDSNGSLAPATVEYSVLVSLVPLKVVLIVPAIVFVGFPTQVSGSLTANGSAVQDAKFIQSSSELVVNTTSDKKGGFQFGFTPPLTLPTGYWSFRVGVYPKESWVQARIVSVKVLVINPLTLLGPASGIFLVGLVVLKRRNARVAVLEEPETDAPDVVQEKLAYEERLPLVDIYLRAVEIISKIAGIRPQPTQTLREYLRMVQGVEGASHFERITVFLEEALYGHGYCSGAEIEASLELTVLKAETNAA